MKFAFVTRNLKGMFGGAEIYNDNITNSFLKLGNEVEKVDYKTSGSLFRERVSILFSALKSQSKVMLVSHCGFLDLLSVPVYKAFGKKVYVLSHVGRGYGHIENKISFAIVRFIIKYFVEKHFLLTRDQAEKFKSKKYKIIPTVIRDQFHLNELQVVDDVNPYVLFYGRVSVDKGCLDLINALSALKYDYVLKLAGPVEEKDKDAIDRAIENSTLKGRVEFCGVITNVDELVSLIDRSTIVAFPTHYDLYPLVGFETFLRKKICVVSNIAAYAELFDCQDMLCHIKDEEDLQRVLGLYLTDSNKCDEDATMMYEQISSMKLTGTNCAQIICSEMNV